ncbi:MAG: hypothetical protein EHM33_02015 [Chloroflexi bacterium]|nr:MAG: hypothetical protein EHM33_02015 [Chloroflexota bacterium]
MFCQYPDFAEDLLGPGRHLASLVAERQDAQPFRVGNVSQLEVDIVQPRAEVERDRLLIFL